MFVLSGYVNSNNVSATDDMLSRISASEHKPLVYSDNNCSLGIKQITKFEAFGTTEYATAPEYAIAFSGNIHNLSDILKDLDPSPSTKDQAEVVLLAYKAYGKDFVKRLRGSFGFAIWDKENKGLFLARDGFGIKPFYYYQIE